LQQVQEVLDHDPFDLNALALKGNLLDLRAAIAAELGLGDEAEDEWRRARRCYETMLKVDANSVRAMIDLGDHCARKTAHKDAIGWFDRAIDLLDAGHYFSSVEEDLAEALAGKRDSLLLLGRDQEAVQVNADGRRRCPDSDAFG
jgi:lipopolysaccharide biosynthesis regulator YciM